MLEQIYAIAHLIVILIRRKIYTIFEDANAEWICFRERAIHVRDFFSGNRKINEKWIRTEDNKTI
jgi:hypothetical protein